MFFFYLGLSSSSLLFYSKELLTKAVRTAPIYMKGCVTVGREVTGMKKEGKDVFVLWTFIISCCVTDMMESRGLVLV